MKPYKFKLFADYFQFYLQDERAEGDLTKSWTNEATTRTLALAPGVIGIGTLRNVNVDIIVDVHEKEPPLRLTEWDHVVEGEVDLPTGQIVVAGCSDYFPNAARIEVTPGHYRTRLCSSGFDTISAEWEEAEDLYLVQLWQGEGNEVRLLKHYTAKAGI